MHVFLFSIAQGRFWVPVALAGDTSDEHARGVFLARGLRGDDSFGLWRVSRARRAPRDPDLPEQVAALERFFRKWRPLILEAIDVYPDPADRHELHLFLDERPEETERGITWNTWSFTNCFEYLAKGELYGPLWKRLVEQGVEAELAECKAVLEDVHAYLREVPLEQEELDAIAQSLEGYGESVRKWLDERRRQLASLDPSDIEVLGLGETVPPPGFEPPLVLLSHIASVGRA
ncbi:MAG: hypothetical protein J0L92_22935 [Deltaproteobacteria bacterium]|nr:hypothetical protein [Deltaproteobacteria bacterium]